jgi:hypothetical protein
MRLQRDAGRAYRCLTVRDPDSLFLRGWSFGGADRKQATGRLACSHRENGSCLSYKVLLTAFQWEAVAEQESQVAGWFR